MFRVSEVVGGVVYRQNTPFRCNNSSEFSRCINRNREFGEQADIGSYLRSLGMVCSDQDQCVGVLVRERQCAGEMAV